MIFSQWLRSHELLSSAFDQAGYGYVLFHGGVPGRQRGALVKRFKTDPANRGKVLDAGVWRYTRHPNYFGEIVLWIGVAVIALPVLRGWQWVTLISPVFVTVLLTRISGVPMLEKRADEKWGGQDDYDAYKKRTPLLIPRL